VRGASERGKKVREKKKRRKRKKLLILDSIKFSVIKIL
jgi:hypothetical protein